VRTSKSPAPGSVNAFLQQEAENAKAGSSSPLGGPLKYEPGRQYEHLATVDIPLELLDRNKFQPRGWVNPVKRREIANSIKAQGQLQAITVKQLGDRFMIIGGETRVQAIQLLQDEEPPEEKRRYLTVRAEVRHGVNDSILAMEALHENVMREDLNPMDVAAQLALLREKLELKTAKEVAQAVGQDERKVRTLLMLHDSCPPVIHAAVRGQDLKAFLKIEDDEGGEGRGFSLPADAPRREELMLARDAAVEFAKLYSALRKADPRKATQGLARRIMVAIEEQWSVAKVRRFVQEQTDKGRGKNGPKRASPSLWRMDESSVVLNLRLIAEAPDEEIAALRTKLDELLRERHKYAKPQDVSVATSSPEESEADEGEDGAA
jgi:ParB/RepB/Spo0J family partition protein